MLSLSILLLALWILSVFWVHGDARRLRNQRRIGKGPSGYSPSLWSILVCFFPLISALWYLLASRRQALRAPARKTPLREEDHGLSTLGKIGVSIGVFLILAGALSQVGLLIFGLVVTVASWYGARVTTLHDDELGVAADLYQPVPKRSGRFSPVVLIGLLALVVGAVYWMGDDPEPTAPEPMETAEELSSSAAEEDLTFVPDEPEPPPTDGAAASYTEAWRGVLEKRLPSVLEAADSADISQLSSGSCSALFDAVENLSIPPHPLAPRPEGQAANTAKQALMRAAEACDAGDRRAFAESLMLVDVHLAQVELVTRSLGSSDVLWRVEDPRPQGSVTASQWPKLNGRASHCLWTRAREGQSSETAKCGNATLPNVTQAPDPKLATATAPITPAAPEVELPKDTVRISDARFEIAKEGRQYNRYRWLALATNTSQQTVAFWAGATYYSRSGKRLPINDTGTERIELGPGESRSISVDSLVGRATIQQLGLEDVKVRVGRVVLSE